jgi:uncharacterized Zn-binding protein involved in type VI secretion
MALDSEALGRALAHGAADAQAVAESRGGASRSLADQPGGPVEHVPGATDVVVAAWKGAGYQGAANLLDMVNPAMSTGSQGRLGSTPLHSVPGAMEMAAGDVKAAFSAVSEAEGALATTGAVFGALTAVEQLISAPFSAIPFPAFPAVRILDTDVGLPHAHGHPPNLIPPAPPVPLPSAGPVIPIPYISGASTVLINGMPAARCGDMGLGIWCGGYFPMFEIFLGSSSVWIEGARAARLGVDITKHCTFTTPRPSDPPLGPMVGALVQASPNVIIGGIPMPSLSSMAIGAAVKVAFAGLSKLARAAGGFSRRLALRMPGRVSRKFALLSEADPARRVLGPASKSHSQEIAEMRKALEEAGVEVRERTDALAYAPGLKAGRPGQFIIDPDASFSAWTHEYQHFLDDKAAGWQGFAAVCDSDIRWAMEQSAYGKEIDMMEKLGHADVASELGKLMEQERQRIFGELPEN